MIVNTLGEDIGPILRQVAADAGLATSFLYGAIIAESGNPPNPRAERWGSQTHAAQAAIGVADMVALARILASSGADVSFGYGQQVLLYHYAGNRTSTLQNALAVRDEVFANPVRNLRDCAYRLRANLITVQNKDLSLDGGDVEIAALIVYNAGSYRTDAAWRRTWAGNIKNYRDALAYARHKIAQEGEPMTESIAHDGWADATPADAPETLKTVHLRPDWTLGAPWPTPGMQSHVWKDTNGVWIGSYAYGEARCYVGPDGASEVWTSITHNHPAIAGGAPFR